MLLLQPNYHSCAILSIGQRSQAERQAVNTVCQGSAADLVKLAMIQLHQKVQQELPADSCRLLLQVGCCCMTVLLVAHTCVSCHIADMV